MAINITWTWTNEDGGEATDDETAGYNVSDYFDMPLRDILNAGTPAEALSLLQASYRGVDIDGIGLSWIVE